MVCVVLCVKNEEMVSSMWKLGDGKRKEKQYEKEKKIKKIYIYIYIYILLGMDFGNEATFMKICKLVY